MIVALWLIEIGRYRAKADVTIQLKNKHVMVEALGRAEQQIPQSLQCEHTLGDTGAAGADRTLSCSATLADANP